MLTLIRRRVFLAGGFAFCALIGRVSAQQPNPIEVLVCSGGSSLGIRYQLGQDAEGAHHPLWTPDGTRLIYFRVSIQPCMPLMARRAQCPAGFEAGSVTLGDRRCSVSTH